MSMTVEDWIGIAGAMLIVIAYLLVQLRRLDALSLSFSLANGIGAAGIIFSLLNDFNLSAFAIEVFWLAISLYGVVRALRSRKETVNAAERGADRP